MIRYIMQVDRVDLHELFFSSGHYYYRPLLVLSFHLDNFLTGCNIYSMHLHNVFLHVLNGLLVLVCARNLFVAYDVETDVYAPLFAALLFALHPVNTEAVNWISGRTDLLAAFFCLSSLVLILTPHLTFTRSILAALLFLFGLFSKEVAIALIPVLFMHFFWLKNNARMYRLRHRISLFLPFLAASAVYFFMRGVGTSRVDVGMATATKSMYDDYLGAASGATKAFGFYIKKLFAPLPLNFGIVEIDTTFYFWFGLFSIIVSLLVLVFRRRVAGFCTCMTICFFLPAVTIALNKMAWTPLAERYVYISSVGVSIAVVIAVFSFFHKRSVSYGILTALLVLAFPITFDRNLTWQDNISLYKDTMEKSPSFIPAYNEYATALMQSGKFDESLAVLERTRTLRHWKSDDRFLDYLELNKIIIETRHDPLEDRKHAFQQLLRKSRHPLITDDLRQRIYQIIAWQIREEKNPIRLKEHQREALVYIQEMNRDGRNVFYHYRAGQLYLQLDEKALALASFRKAYELGPHTEYGPLALKLIRKLENE